MINRLFDILNHLILDLFSFVFRFLIVFYGIVIVINHDNIFGNWIYTIITIIYVSTFLFFKLKIKRLALIRSVLDIAYIFIILYDKDIKSIQLIMYYILPLVNYANHSGLNTKKRSLFIMFFLWFGLLFVLNSLKLNVEIVIIFIFYILIVLVHKLHNHFENISHKIEANTTEIYENLDSEKNQIPHLLLKKLVKDINHYLKNKIINIYCFQYLGHELYIKYSTNFIINYSIKYKVDEEDDKKYRIEFNADGKDVENLVAYKLENKDQDVLYVLQLEDNLKVFDQIIVDKYIRKSLVFINKVIMSNISFDIQNKELKELYNKKIAFINETHNAMHYVKNNLTPIQSYLDVIFMLLDENKVDESYEKEYLNNEREYVNEILSTVKSYSMDILDNSNEVLSDLRFEVVNYQRIISIVRSNWHKYYQEDPIIKIHSVFTAKEKEMKFWLQDIYLETLIDNVISNMKKHSSGRNNIIIEFEGSCLILSFKNETRKGNSQKLKELASTFNKYKRKEEIIKTFSNGLYQIIILSNNLMIKPKLKVNDKDSLITFEFRIDQYEGGEDEKNPNL